MERGDSKRRFEALRISRRDRSGGVGRGGEQLAETSGGERRDGLTDGQAARHVLGDT